MAGRGGERKCAVERKGIVHQQRLAGINNWSAIVGPHVAGWIGALPGHLLPVGVLALVEDVLRVWKRRHPTTIAQHRVPAGVINVQMCAKYVRDVREAQASCLKIVEPGLLGKIEGRRVSLVLARAGVDEDCVLWRAD